MPRVYLAGPITGTTYDQAQAWRDRVAADLTPHGIACYSPLRCQEYLRNEGVLTNSGTRYAYRALTSGKGLTTRDYNDVVHADAILANLDGTTAVSIGTVMEIAWAYQARIPVVLVAALLDFALPLHPPLPPNPHDHAMIRECVPFIVSTLDEAVEITRSILLP